jgi:glutaredoxin 3
VKEFLTQNNIEFQDRDVAADRDAAKEMIEKTQQMGVPVIIIDDKDIVIGFDQSKLAELLEIKN